MKEWMKKNFLLVLVGTLGVGFLLSLYSVKHEGSSGPPKESFDSGQFSPQWALPDLEGNIFRSRDLNGKVAVLNFWATWCKPCLAEIPLLVYLQNTYGPQGVEVVGISLDQNEEALKRFVEKRVPNYKILRDDFSVMSQFVNFQGVPVTVILDREGRIAEVFMGGVSKYALEQTILKVLQNS